MVGQSSFLFFDKASTPSVSKSYRNIKADVASVEFSGTFSSGKFYFEGKLDLNSPNWTPLVAINLSNYALVSEVTQAGIYELGIEGVQLFRVRIEEISGGEANVYARIVNTIGG